MIYTVSITKKGQMTLPKALRQQLNVAVPSRVTISSRKDGSIVIGRPKTIDDIPKALGKPSAKDPLSEREKLIGPYLAKKYGVR